MTAVILHAGKGPSYLNEEKSVLPEDNFEGGGCITDSHTPHCKEIFATKEEALQNRWHGICSRQGDVTCEQCSQNLECIFYNA